MDIDPAMKMNREKLNFQVSEYQNIVWDQQSKPNSKGNGSILNNYYRIERHKMEWMWNDYFAGW